MELPYNTLRDTLLRHDMKVYRMPFSNRLIMSQLEKQDAKDLRTIRKTITSYTYMLGYYADYNILADIVDNMAIQDSMKINLNNLLSGLANYSYEILPAKLENS